MFGFVSLDEIWIAVMFPMSKHKIYRDLFYCLSICAVGSARCQTHAMRFSQVISFRSLHLAVVALDCSVAIACEHKKLDQVPYCNRAMNVNLDVKH